ncbi:MAG TPA: flagellar basal body P-ring protein FlgI, partial [Bryobacteraceae bacterium]|nr:flagellar basal body P-ring protein FlgI [Bryobacteraceae bacterium]
MDRPLLTLLRRASAALCTGLVSGAMMVGCNHDVKRPIIKEKYPSLPAKIVPPYMHRTIYEEVDLGNTDPYPISSYGLVVGLSNTGDTTAPTAVREYMIKEMTKHGFGSRTIGMERQSPEVVLRDRSVAIVQVVGMLPPGVRKYQNFDVYVSCLPGNQTYSLAGGKLFLAELRKDGANPRNPFGAVNVFGQAKGFIFVNPAYALNHEPTPRGPARASLRNGVILDGGVALFDRPLFLRLRQPQFRLSRSIEQRLIERFQDTKIAQAEDEGIVQIYVPPSYHGDWGHFAQLAMHVYLESTPEFEAVRAQQLVQEAMKPDAALEDISYCWEALGASALPYLAPLLADHGTRPEVAFAAARAAAYIGDPTGAGATALMQMARSPENPFQLNAVQALGGMPPSGTISHMLRELLDSEKTQVRIEAYKILARNNDAIIQSEVVTKTEDHQKFVLDVVPTKGRPLIFATRSG